MGFCSSPCHDGPKATVRDTACAIKLQSRGEVKRMFKGSGLNLVATDRDCPSYPISLLHPSLLFKGRGGS